MPPGAVWPLPANELALLTAGEVREMGQDDVAVTVVTPERSPLPLFGDEASTAVAEELRSAGIELRTGAVARRDATGVVLEPSGERLDVQHPPDRRHVECPRKASAPGSASSRSAPTARSKWSYPCSRLLAS